MPKYLDHHALDQYALTRYALISMPWTRSAQADEHPADVYWSTDNEMVPCLD